MRLSDGRIVRSLSEAAEEVTGVKGPLRLGLLVIEHEGRLVPLATLCDQLLAT